MTVKLTYNAVFFYDFDGINVTFPGIYNALTCGDTRQECIYMAKDVLALVFDGERRDSLPAFVPADEIQLEENCELESITIEMEERDGVLFSMALCPENQN